MNIVIDTRWIFPQLSGIGRYTQELVRALLAIDTTNQYILLHDNPEVMERLGMEWDLASHSNARQEQVPYGLFSLKNQLSLGRQLKAWQCDVFHSPNYMIPLRPFPMNRTGSLACVVTMHDLIPLLFKDHAPRSKKARLFFIYQWLMNQVAHRADAVLAVSESSRQDILKQFGLPESQVHTVYNGLGQQFVPIEEPKNSMILYVGRLDPYKNVPLLVKAFAELGHRMPELRLELVSEPDPRYPEAEALIADAGLNDRVTWHKGLSDDALVKTYQRAAVTVLPSRYEGFGLPVAESMACGTPVICSRNSSLPEVGGDAALYIQSEDPFELAARLEQVLTNEETARRMREQGLEQARQFTWSRCAQETLRVYTTLRRA